MVVKILWIPKMFTIFVSTKGSFPLKEISCQRAQNEACFNYAECSRDCRKEILRLREQRF